LGTRDPGAGSGGGAWAEEHRLETVSRKK